MRTRVLLAILPAVAVQGACNKVHSVATPTEPQGRNQTVSLRVSLYPWIPAPEGFEEYVEAAFELAHPNIDLIVRPFEASHDWLGGPGFIGDLAYDDERTIAALSDSDDDAQDIVELDTMILGRVVKSGMASATRLPQRRFIEAGVDAVSLDGQTWGVPHWMCGYFIISADDRVVQAGSITELSRALAEHEAPLALTGDLDGSWDTLTAYLDLIRDTDPNADLAYHISSDSIPHAASDDLLRLGALCTTDGETACSGTFGGVDSVQLFASGQATALVGYSERLHAILETDGNVHDPSLLGIASAPLGSGNHPTLFTDALVTSKSCAERPECAEAAAAFSRWYTDTGTFHSLLLTDDQPGKPPRYLLPATYEALEALEADPLYSSLSQSVIGATPFPSHGVPEARERNNEALRTAIWSKLGGR